MQSMELYRDKGRKTWFIRFTDHRGLRRFLSSRTRDRGTALGMANKIEMMINAKLRGDPSLPKDLVEWANGQRPQIRDKIVGWGLLSPAAAITGTRLYNEPDPDPIPPGWRAPPPALLDQWEQEFTEREVTGEHSRQTVDRVRTLLMMDAPDRPPIVYAADITADAIKDRVVQLRRVGPKPKQEKRKRRRLSPSTCQYYLDRARDFCRWLVGKGVLISNPLTGVVAFSAAVRRENKERQRRALSIEEQILLINGTAKFQERWGMSGFERSLIYRTVLRTGLRAGEVDTLTVAGLNFWAKTITVLAKHGKSSRRETLPMAEELVEPLKAQIQGKLPAAPVFTPIGKKKYCEMLREDLAELKIPYEDDLDGFADFHALRHTYATELAKVVMPATHMKLMRHQDIRTTMGYYVHVEDQEKAAGIAKLPSLEETPNKKIDGQTG